MVGRARLSLAYAGIAIAGLAGCGLGLAGVAPGVEEDGGPTLDAGSDTTVADAVDEGNPVDSPSAADMGGGGDTASDTRAPDGDTGPPPDAPIDHKLDGPPGDGATNWCATQPLHLLCEDFDVGSFPPGQWGMMMGGPARDSTHYQSAPWSMLTTSGVWVAKGFGAFAQGQTATLNFDFYPNPVPGTIDVAIILLFDASNTQVGSAAYRITSTGSHVNLCIAGSCAFHDAVPAPTSAAWSHVTLQVLLDATSGSSTLDVAGQMASHSGDPTMDGTAAKLGLLVGLAPQGVSGQNANIDNVTFDLK